MVRTLHQDSSRDVRRLLRRLEGAPLSDAQRHRAAQVLRKLGAPLDALDLMERVLPEGPEDWSLRFELNHSLHRQPEAARCLDKAVADNPTNARLARRAIEFRMAARDLPRAMAMVDSALLHSPQDPHLLFLRADLSSRLRPETADSDIEQAWLAAPSHGGPSWTAGHASGDTTAWIRPWLTDSRPTPKIPPRSLQPEEWRCGEGKRRRPGTGQIRPWLRTLTTERVTSFSAPPR